MTEPVVFTSASPRFAIPLLFAGQAQKEVFVNEAHLRTEPGQDMAASWRAGRQVSGSFRPPAMACAYSTAPPGRIFAISMDGSALQRRRCP